MSPFIYIISILWSACIGGLVWYALRSAQQISYVTLADGRRSERRIPLLFRLLLPFAPNFRGLFSRPFYDRSRKRIERDLTAAGFDTLISSLEFLSLRILSPLVIAPTLCLLIHILFSAIPGGLGVLLMKRAGIIYLITVLYFFTYPALWLRSTLRSRHRSIERALPFVLDLMTLSVEAGLDFMGAIQRIIERRGIDALGEELIQVFREVQLGKTRRQALRSMSDRARQPDLSSVVHALVQADELGVSIGAILRIQAEQVRGRRFQRAEKAANEAPVKMIFPLVAFIFPAVFIVLLGPILLQVAQHGF